jgi:hypothetical protein
MKNRMELAKFLRRVAAMPNMPESDRWELIQWAARHEDTVFMATAVERGEGFTVGTALDASRRLLREEGNAAKVLMPAVLLQQMVDSLAAVYDGRTPLAPPRAE